MGGLTPRLTPLDWPAAVQLDGDGLALVLLTLSAGTARPAARQIARQVLRQILGGLLACPADEVALHESTQGPVLAEAARDIRISLSYAADRCLIGLAEGHALGVDIVRIESLPEIEPLCRLYLPAADCRRVLAAPPAERNARFALAWAQMEARSKCLGLPLAEIDRQREQTLNAGKLADCIQTGDYRIALASSEFSSEHVSP